MKSCFNAKQSIDNLWSYLYYKDMDHPWLKSMSLKSRLSTSFQVGLNDKSI